MDLIDPLDIWENCYCLLRPGKQSCPPSGISWYFYVGFFTCFRRQPRDWFWKVQPWYIQFNENFQNNLNGVNSFIRKSKKGPRGALCIPYLTKCQEEQPIQFFSWSISFYPSSRHITLHKHTYKANLKVAGHDVPVTCLKFNVCWYLSNNISLWNWWFDKKKLNKCRARF